MGNLTVSEKLDRIEKFLKKNPGKRIKTDTVYNGEPIGTYVIYIRQLMLYGKGRKCNEEDRKRAQKLGILYEKRDTLNEKIKKIINFCREYPYAFSYATELTNKLIDDGKEEEAMQLQELYQKAFPYIKLRIKNDREVIDRLREAKVSLTAFGLAEEDNELSEKYGIDKKIIVELYKDFGSIDNFRKKYIDYLIKIANAKNDLEGREIQRQNSDLCQYIDKLPLAGPFIFDENKGYQTLVMKLYKKDYTNHILILDNGYNSAIENILKNLSPRDQRIIKASLGLDGEKKLTIAQMAEEFKVSENRIIQMKDRILDRIKNSKELEPYVDKATEEFIRTYFEEYNIFVAKNEPILEKDGVKRLLQLKRRKYEIRELLKNRKGEVNPLEVRIEDMEFDERAYNCLSKEKIMTLDALLLKKPEDLLRIKGLGRITLKKIMDKVHDFGYKFGHEEKILRNFMVEHKDDPLRMSIRDLDMWLSERARNCLVKAGYTTLQDVLEKVEDRRDLLNIRSFGKKSLRQLEFMIHHFGYKFKYEEESNPNQQQIGQKQEQQPVLEEYTIEGCDTQLKELLQMAEDLDSYIEENLLELEKIADVGNKIPIEMIDRWKTYLKLINSQRRMLRILERFIKKEVELEKRYRDIREELIRRSVGTREVEGRK